MGAKVALEAKRRDGVVPCPRRVLAGGNLGIGQAQSHCGRSESIRGVRICLWRSCHSRGWYAIEDRCTGRQFGG
jgi:hypothetical protein